MSVTLEELERLAYRHHDPRAVDGMIQLLLNLQDRGLHDARLESAKENHWDLLATRISGVLTLLLAAPRTILSQAGYERLLCAKLAIDGVWRIGGYQMSRHLLHLIGDSDKGRQASYSIDQLGKLLAGSLHEELPPTLLAAFDQLPDELVGPLVLSVIGQEQVLTREAEAIRDTALGLGHRLDGLELTPERLILASRAWMQCSYALDERKHRIKGDINRMLRRWSAAPADDGREPAPRAPGAARPTLLVVAEWFDSLHAMYRCYAPSLRALRRRFRLVLLYADAVDATAKALFDETLALTEEDTDPREWVETARSARPDLVYFPSVGMRPWSIVLANQRIAPIQFISMGHPATSHSDAIDYLITSEGSLGDPARVSERVLLYPSAPSYEMRHDARPPAPAPRRSPTPVRLAIPAATMKLNHRFLDTCREIAERSNRPLEFHFFINGAGLHHRAAEVELRRRLPAAVVHHSTGYNDYVERIDRCDIHLSSFPFGATNGVVDSALQGLPILCLRGREIHGHIDAGLSLRLGLPEWLRARDRPSYVEAALRLIDDDAERLALAHHLILHARPALLLEPGASFEPFGELVWGLYRHHRRLQADRRKVWHLDQLRQEDD